MSADDLEERFTLDQIRLKYHFIQRRVQREMHLNHQVMRAAVLEAGSKLLGGG